MRMTIGNGADDAPYNLPLKIGGPVPKSAGVGIKQLRNRLPSRFYGQRTIHAAPLGRILAIRSADCLS